MKNNNDKKIFNIKSISVFALSLLLILLFLSKTLYNYNLPVVTAVLPSKGTLNKIELTTGIVNYEDVSEIYSQVGGRLDDILVKEGDVVTKGQPVIQMSFEKELDEINKQLIANREEVQKKLNDLKISRDKLQVDIEKINTNIRNIERKIEELTKEEYKQDSISDYELVQCLDDISKAQKELADIKALFEIGAISRQDLTNAENKVGDLESKYENIKRVYDENIEKNNEDIADKETNREKQLKDYEYQLETYNQELRSKDLDLNANSIQESALRKDLETNNADLNEALAEYEKNTIVYANEDSFVTSITVNKGQFINANQHLMSFGISKEYVVECEVSLNNNFVTVSDNCYLSNSSNTLEGVVTKVTPSERSKEITISIQSDKVSAGETFEIKFEKVSSESYTLVPNGAVNMDSDGYFLSQIKRRNGILGKEFYTEKLRVYIGDSDSENTVIVKGVGFFEPIVLLSDKPFSENDTIKLKNEGDFFEE